MGFIREKDSWCTGVGKKWRKKREKKLINKKNPMIRTLSKLDCN